MSLDTKVVNLYGGPCIGKTTLAASVFAYLKKSGVDVELVSEYARDMVYDGAFKTLENQLYIFAHQHHRLWRLRGKVEVVVTDSPLLLTLPYDPTQDPAFKAFVYHEYRKFHNLDFILKRETQFTRDGGRRHDEEESLTVDIKIREILDDFKIPYAWADFNTIIETIWKQL